MDESKLWPGRWRKGWLWRCGRMRCFIFFSKLVLELKVEDEWTSDIIMTHWKQEQSQHNPWGSPTNQGAPAYGGYGGAAYGAAPYGAYGVIFSGTERWNAPCTRCLVCQWGGAYGGYGGYGAATRPWQSSMTSCTADYNKNARHMVVARARVRTQSFASPVSVE